MNYRIEISAGLVVLSILLLILPGGGRYRFSTSPSDLVAIPLEEQNFYPVDKVAGALVNDDSTIVLVDVRTPEEYNTATIPGAINIPLEIFCGSDMHSHLSAEGITCILFSNDERDAMAALLTARGMGYNGTVVMEGGMNEWYRTIIESEFSPGNLTPAQNALYGTRLRARTLFTEINSLPEPMKRDYMESKRRAARELDGGCE